MYGLVNKAVQGLICDRFGEETWNRILEESGVDIADFVAMQAYDDQVTLDLVATASRVLDAPADGLLEAFGEYWTDLHSGGGLRKPAGLDRKYAYGVSRQSR